MAIHVIPVTEADLHQEDPACQCEPDLKMDEESGEMVWAHQLLQPERLINDLIKL
jgi:hypothetical protein